MDIIATNDSALVPLTGQLHLQLNSSGAMIDIARFESICSSSTLINPLSWNRGMNSLPPTNPETSFASLSSSKWTFKTTSLPDSFPFLNSDNRHRAFSIWVHLKQKLSRSSGYRHPQTMRVTDWILVEVTEESIATALGWSCKNRRDNTMSRRLVNGENMVLEHWTQGALKPW